MGIQVRSGGRYIFAAMSMAAGGMLGYLAGQALKDKSKGELVADEVQKVEDLKDAAVDIFKYAYNRVSSATSEGHNAAKSERNSINTSELDIDSPEL